MVENKAFQNKFDHLKKTKYILLSLVIIVVKFLHFFKVLDAMSQDRKNYIPDTLSPHQGFLDQNWEALRIS